MLFYATKLATQNVQEVRSGKALKKYTINFFRLLLFCLLSSNAVAQTLQLLPETPLNQFWLSDTARVQQLVLNIKGFGFIHNNEYFSLLQPGQTYFGQQLLPQLLYRPHPHWQLEAGVFLQQDFGTERLRRNEFVFALHYIKKHFNLRLGQLQGSTSRNLPLPLYQLERAFTQPIERGLQLQWVYPKGRAEAWIDWQQQIYATSTTPEIIWGGFSGQYLLNAENSSSKVHLLAAATAWHQGGQIGQRNAPVYTVANSALGLQISTETPWQFTGRYWLMNALTPGWPVNERSGTGQLVQLQLARSFKQQQQTIARLSYWHSWYWFAPMGQPLLNYATDQQAIVSPERSSIALLVQQQWQVAPNLQFLLRAEPQYLPEEEKVELNYSFYINFQLRHKLLNLKYTTVR